MLRNDRYWAKLQIEAPESLISLAEDLEKNGKLTLDGYASLAGGLSSAQLAGMRRPVLLRFGKDPLVSAPSLLRLWSLLSTDQRNAARSEGLIVASLDPTQQSDLLLVRRLST